MILHLEIEYFAYLLVLCLLTTRIVIGFAKPQSTLMKFIAVLRKVGVVCNYPGKAVEQYHAAEGEK